MYEILRILLVACLVLFVATLLGALVQGFRGHNRSSRHFGIATLVMAVLSVGSFWGVSAAKPTPNNNQAAQSSSTSSSSSSSSVQSSHSTSSQKKESHRQRHQGMRDRHFEQSDMHRRDEENRRQESMLAKRGTDKRGYREQISHIPDQSSHVVEKVTYDGKDTTVATISSDLTENGAEATRKNAFTIWNGLRRISFIHHVKANIIIKNHKGKEIANSDGNRFNFVG